MKIKELENEVEITFCSNKTIYLEYSVFLALNSRQYFRDYSTMFVHVFVNYTVNIENFYPLAKMINKKIPNNIINWVDTFAVFETINYESAINRKNDVKTKEEEAIDFEDWDLNDILENPVEYDLGDSNFRNKLIQGVRERLIQEKIIKN